MIVHDRRIAEIMIEDIFLSSHNSFVLVDYNDIRTIRRYHTLRFLYNYNLQVDQIYCWKDNLKEELSPSWMSYCAVEISYGKGMSNAPFYDLMNTVHDVLKGVPILNCSHMSDKLAADVVVVNLYFFSPKSDEDYDIDKRIDNILENYHTICSSCDVDYETGAEMVATEVQLVDLTQPELDSDSRIAAYTGVISQLTVNDDSAFFIKQIVDEAVMIIEQYIQKGKNVRISTIQNFVFYAGNLWMHLDGYYTQDELKETAQRWYRVLHDARVNTQGYLKDAADFADELRNVWVENLSDDEFDDLLIKSKEFAEKGNNTNRADIFSALEHICRDAHIINDTKKCISLAELAIEIASNENAEINFLDKRIEMFNVLISRNIEYAQCIKRKSTGFVKIFGAPDV